MKTCKTIIASSLMLAGMLGIFGTDYSIADCKQETQYSEQQVSKKREEINRFDNGNTSSVKTFLEEKLVNEKYWSIDGVNTVDIDYLYSKKDGTYEKVSYTTDTPSKHVKDKEKLKGSPEGKSTLLQKWFYNQGSYTLISSEYYREGTEIVEKLDSYDKEEKLESTYIYHYIPGSEEKRRVKGFEIYSPKGEKIGHYSEDAKLNIEDIILSRDISPEQAKELLKIYNSKRTPVVIIDSGFDISHESLTHKLWKNPKETLNGRDDDNNGWIDDVMGWNRHENKVLGINVDSPNIKEVIVLHDHEPPLSHGTHVASIALKDTDKFALVGFAGDMTNPEYLNRISKFLRDHNILFANMSFGFGDIEGYCSPNVESFFALERLIKDNPQTLFFIASGNDGKDIDKSNLKTYPPSYDYNNMLVVGALDTDELIESKLQIYKSAEFSNTGTESVDIFAPGTDVSGALIGNSVVRKSGTSMASPYALNLALKIYEENPDLDTSKIKEIMLKTAYVNPDNPLPTVSKGIIHPDKALSVAKMLKENPALSVEEAVKLYKCYELCVEKSS